MLQSLEDTSLTAVLEGFSHEEPKADSDHEHSKISLPALSGWSRPKTMRVTTIINKQTEMELIDSGSTHNFISEKVACSLHLPVSVTRGFTVRVANGEWGTARM